MNILPTLHLAPDSNHPEIVSIVGGGGKSSTMFQLADELVASGKRVVTTTTTNIGPGQVLNAPAVLRVDNDQLSFSDLAKLLEQHHHCLLVSPEKPATRGYKVSGISPQLVDALSARAGGLGIDAVIVEADGSHRLPIKAPAEYEPVVADSTTMLIPVAGIDSIGKPILEEYVHRPERIRQVLNLPSCDSESSEIAWRLSPQMIAKLFLAPDGGAKSLPAGARFQPIVTKVNTPPRLAAARAIAAQALTHQQSMLIASIVRSERDPEANAEIAPLSKDPILERWGATTTVILAAGQSKRMGRPKQLEVVDGERMILRAVRTALRGPAQQVMVVLGAYADRLQETLPPLLANSAGRLSIIENPEWQTGQASSVRAAIKFLLADTPTSAHAVLFMPVDQPFVKPLLLKQLVRAWQRGAQLVAPQIAGKPRGAPALFDRSLWPEMLTLTGDSGAKSILAKYQRGLQTVSATEKELFDINSPADIRTVIA